MKKYIRLILLILSISIICSLLVCCSKDEKNDIIEPPALSEARDTYMLSLFSLTSGGLSFYDYDSSGRLLAVYSADPHTMRIDYGNNDQSVIYEYENDKLTKVYYWSYELQAEYDDRGYPKLAAYSDSEISVRIDFVCTDDGRIRKESVYADDSLFYVAEYAESGLLEAEEMNSTGSASYVYTEDYTKAKINVISGSAISYKMIYAESLPKSFTLTSDNSTQYMSWSYNERGNCEVYCEFVDNCVTQYMNEYDSVGQLLSAKTYYAADGIDSVMIECVDYEYWDDGSISKKSVASYNYDGGYVSQKVSEFSNNYQTSYLEVFYLNGKKQSSVLDTYEYDEAWRVVKLVTVEYDENDILQSTYTELSEYDENGLLVMLEEINADEEGTATSRCVNELEYDSEKRPSKITMKYYDDDIYSGMETEEYVYSEEGTYELTVSEYDADGNLINQTTDTYELN